MAKERYNFEDTPLARRKIMRAIKRKDTSCELALRRELFRRGFRYRIDYGKLPGRPDIAFIKKKIAIFCDSEFWHGRNWDNKKERIKTNRDYWLPKIEKNIARDKKNNELLRELGWCVMRFWDSDIKKNLFAIANTIEQEVLIRTKS